MKKVNEEKMGKLGRLLGRFPMWVLMAFAVILTCSEGMLVTKFQLVTASICNGFSYSKVVDMVVIQAIITAMNILITAMSKVVAMKVKNKKYYYYMERTLNSSVGEINKTSTGKIFDAIKDASECSGSMMKYLIWIFPTIIPFTIMLWKEAQSSLLAVGITLFCMVLTSVMVYLSDKIFKFDTVAKKYNSMLSGTTVDIFMNIKTAKYIHESNWCLDKELDAQRKAFPFFVNTGKITWNRISYFITFIPTVAACVIFKDNLEMITYIILSDYLINKTIDYIISILELHVEKNAALDVIKNLDGADADVVENDMPNKMVLEDVYFDYGMETTSFHIDNLTFEKGKRYHVTGESGHGKSSLANLIVGAIPARSGNVQKVKTYYVYQETEMFNDTLRNNIAFGDNVSDEEILDLISELKLEKMYMRMTHGLDTVIGERGCRISSGEKQRINIMRAILRMRKNIDEMIILDEITSNLDSEAEKIAINMIDRECKGTLLLISHHGDFDKICDSHIVVKDHSFYQYEKKSVM